MTSKATIRKEVKAAFDKASTKTLSDAAKKARDRIFDLTIGDFAEAGAKVKLDVWQSKKFQAFILGAVEDIAKEASTQTKGTKVSATTLNKVSVSVMKRFKHCSTAIVGNRLIFPDVKEGMVCSAFLNTHL